MQQIITVRFFRKGEGEGRNKRPFMRYEWTELHQIWAEQNYHRRFPSLFYISDMSLRLEASAIQKRLESKSETESCTFSLPVKLEER